MDFIGKIENICLPENNEVVISLSTNNTSILEELENIKNKDKEINIEIKRIYNRRSLDANAYFHFLVNKLEIF